MKYISIFLIALFCFACNSEQLEHENKLLFPKKEKLGFEATFNMQYFPDVTIYFNFSHTPSDKTLAAIESEFEKFEEQYQKIFIHKMKHGDDGRYSISINFNRIDFDTYSEFDMKKDTDLLHVLLKSIDDNPDVQDLLAVYVE